MAKPKKMDIQTLTGVVRSLLRDAEDYSEEIGAFRESATGSYEGAKYGNEEDGRSQVVTREVRDAVETAKPALMRTLFGSHAIVEYAGRGPEDVATAKDATVYAQHVVFNENSGYLEFLSAVEDALIRKTGVLKLWWEDDKTPVQTRHSNLTEEDLELLGADDDVVEIEAEENGEFFAPSVPDQTTYAGTQEETPEPVAMYDATVTRIVTKGTLRFEAVPPEEYVISRKGKGPASTRLVGHRRVVTLSDLVAMGYEWDEVEDLVGVGEEDYEHEEEFRSVGFTTSHTEDDAGDPSMREVMYAELWVRVDFDGDGIAELRRVCVAGSAYKVLENELAEYAPIVNICPSPVAHQAIGRSLAELVEDIQKIKTMMLRNTLDSLANAIHPDTEAVEGQVNFDDLLNTEQGRIIRVKQPGMMRYMQQPFIGREIFPIMQYMDTLSQARTGMNEAAEGLNADALQSTSTAAINNATNSALGRIEHIARNFVEGGLKDFFKILLRLAVENVDRPTWVRLNNRYLQVDPRSWNISMDVVPTVALGEGTIEQRLMFLEKLAAKQEMIIQTAGADNPICGIVEYRNTLAEITKLSGFADVERFLKDPEDPANQPEEVEDEPTPEMIIAQAEAARVTKDGELKDRELELKIWEAIQKDDRERDKFMADAMIRMEELKQKGHTVDIAAIKAEVERSREGHQHLHNMLQDATQARQVEAQAQQAQQQGSQQPPTGAGPAGGMQ